MSTCSNAPFTKHSGRAPRRQSRVSPDRKRVPPAVLGFGFAVFLTCSTSSLAEVPALDHVIISVGDLDRSEKIYTEVLPFRVVSRAQSAGTELRRAWGISTGASMASMRLQHAHVPESPGIRLVQFSPKAPRSRYEYRLQDPGYMDVHLCSDDVVSSYERLIDAGFTAMKEPVLWRGRGGELGVGERAWHEVFMHGPDGEGVTLIPWSERPGCKELSAAAAFGPIRNVTIAVHDLDRAYQFYSHVLGWGRTENRYEAFGPDMEEMLRLPEGAIARALHFGPPPIPWLTLVEFAGIPHIMLNERSAPPYRGLVGLSFRVRDFDGLLTKIKNAGVTIIFPPGRIADPPYDGRRVFTIAGPDHVFMEYVEAAEQTAATSDGAASN